MTARPPRPDPAAIPLRVSLRPGGGRTGLTLSGELDLASEETLRTALRRLDRAGAEPVEVDVSGLRFVDVRGARALVEASERRWARGGSRLILRGADARLRRLLGLMRVDGSVTLAPPRGVAGPMPRPAPRR